MNLYEIMLEHYSQKDSEKGIFTYLAAESDEQVYEYLKSSPTLPDDRCNYSSYQDQEENGEIFDICDKDYKVIGTETFKERMIRLKGEMNDEDVELTDLYYGKTLIGWKTVKENISYNDVDTIRNLGICIQVK